MSAREFEAILDACATDVLAGRRTIERCLADHPEHAEALAPVLATLAPLRATVILTPAAAPDPERRAQLMASICATPQDRPTRMERLRHLVTAGHGSRLRLSTRALRVAAAGVSAAAVVLVAVMLTLTAGTPATAATLTIFGGTVEQYAGSWVPLADGQGVHAGRELHVSPDGAALLTFGDGSTMSLSGGAIVTVEESSAANPRRIRVHQAAGELWHYVRPGGVEATYTVRTSDAEIVAVSTVFGTMIHDGETEVAAAEGTVRVTAAGDTLDLVAGQRALAATQQLRMLTNEATPLQARPIALNVDAPFVASVIAPSGAATGALPGGALFNQIAGAVTTSPVNGEQRIQFERLTTGTYDLLLRRIGAGDGVLTVALGDETREVLLESAGDLVRLHIVVSANGSVSIERGDAPPEMTRPDTVTDDVSTERQRSKESQRSRDESSRGEWWDAPPRAATEAAAPREERLVIPQRLRDELVPFFDRRERRNDDHRTHGHDRQDGGFLVPRWERTPAMTPIPSGTTPSGTTPSGTTPSGTTPSATATFEVSPGRQPGLSPWPPPTATATPAIDDHSDGRTGDGVGDGGDGTEGSTNRGE